MAKFTEAWRLNVIVDGEAIRLSCPCTERGEGPERVLRMLVRYLEECPPERHPIVLVLEKGKI